MNLGVRLSCRPAPAIIHDLHHHADPRPVFTGASRENLLILAAEEIVWVTRRLWAASRCVTFQDRTLAAIGIMRPARILMAAASSGVSLRTSHTLA